MIFRKLLIVTLCAVCSVLLPGCWGQLELDQISIVVGLGVDLEQDGSTAVDAAVVNPSLMRSGQGGGPNTPGPGYIEHQITGKTFEDAMSRFLERPYRQFVMSHNAVTVFGEAYAKRGVEDVFDYIDRTAEIRKDQLLFVMKGRASDLGQKQVGIEKLTSRGLEELIRHSSLSSLALKATDLDVLNLALTPSHTFILPLLEVDDNGVGLAGSAVFDRGKMVQEVGLVQSRGILWWINRSDGALIPISCRGLTQDSSVTLLNTTTTVRPTYHNGQLDVLVRVRGNGELDRVCPHVHVTPDYMKDVARSADQTIQREMSDTLAQFQEAHLDALQIGTRLYRQHPQTWKSVEDRWEDVFARAHVTYDIQVNVIRTGIIQNAPFSKGAIKQVPNLSEDRRDTP